MAFKLVLLSALLVAANALPKPQVLTKTSAIRPVTYTTGGIAYPSPAYGAYSVPTGVHYPSYALPAYVSGVRTIGDAPTHVIAGTGLRTFAGSPAAAIHNFAPAPAVAAAPAVRAVAVPTPVKHLANDEEYDPNPSYSYSYSVNDAETGDSKSAEESRNGDSVQGKYSLIESDGSLRTVEYTADPINGFNAVVHRETGAAVPPPAPIKTETYSAPGAIKVAAAPYVPAPAISYKAVEQPYIALKNTPSVTYTGAPAALAYSQAIPTALRYSQAIPTAVKYSTPVLSTAGNVQTSLVTPYSSYTY